MSDHPSHLTKNLVHWLGTRFPDARNIRVFFDGQPSGGYSNETWLLNLDWVIQGTAEVRPLVLRMAPISDGIFPHYDLNFQYRCMEALRDTEVPVPSLLDFCDEVVYLGAPFYVMERIEGRAPIENPPYHQIGWLKDMSINDQSEVWREGLDTLVAIARVDWRHKGMDFLLNALGGLTPLARILKTCRDHLDWVENRSKPYPVLRRALEWAEGHQPTEESITLCWGDAKLGNCLFNGTRCVAALDWETPHLGNPVSDLAWFLTLDRALSTTIGIPRLPGLWKRDESVQYWSKHSSFSATHLPYYEFLSALKFSIIMASISRVFVQRGWVSKEAEMDTRNAGTAILREYADELGIRLDT
jgi:aminoglycoside phosphotransferase (APT) family kinase protein